MKRYIRNIVKVDDLEPIESMSQIGSDETANMVYYVNPDTNRRGDPYFKVYDNILRSKAKHMTRISFFEPKYIIHKPDKGMKYWKLNTSEIRAVIDYMNRRSALFRITNWQYAMYMWNMEFSFFNNGFDENKYDNAVMAYVDGFYDDEEHLGHPSYVPSFTQIPDYTKLK